MKPEYKNPLPAAVRNLVDEIEAVASREIEVWQDPGISNLADTTFGRSGRLRIRYRDTWGAVHVAYPVPFMPIAHELLHLRRFVIDRVPAMESGGITFMDESGGEKFPDSVLEHCVIEPQLEQYGFPRPDYAPLAETWLRIREAEWGSELERRWNMFSVYLETFFILRNPGILSRAQTILRRAKLLQRAEALTLRLRSLFEGVDPVKAKEAAALELLAAIGINPALARFRYYGHG